MEAKRNRGIFFVLSIALVLFGTHTAITEAFLPDSPIPMPLWLIYSMLSAFALLLLFLVASKMEKSKGGGAKAFIISSVIKMIVSFAVLMIFMFPKTESSKFVVYHFFIAFFPMLLVETLFAIKLINHPFAEKKKIS